MFAYSSPRFKTDNPFTFFDGGVCTSLSLLSFACFSSGDCNAGDFDDAALATFRDPGTFCRLAERADGSSSLSGRLLLLVMDRNSLIRFLNCSLTMRELFCEGRGDGGRGLAGRFPPFCPVPSFDFCAGLPGDAAPPPPPPGRGEVPNGVVDDDPGGFFPDGTDLTSGLALTLEDARGLPEELGVARELDRSFFALSSAAKASSITFGSVGLSKRGNLSSGERGGGVGRCMDIRDRGGEGVRWRFTGRTESVEDVRRMWLEPAEECSDASGRGSGGLRSKRLAACEDAIYKKFTINLPFSRNRWLRRSCGTPSMILAGCRGSRLCGSTSRRWQVLWRKVRRGL